MPSRQRAAELVRAPVSYAGIGVTGLRALASTGILAPVRPDRVARMLAALRLGLGPAAACAAAAARYPGHPGLIDERGPLTFEDLDRRGAAVAGALREDHGVGPERGLAVMCRNHRGFVEATLAASRLGADLLLLNTEFPGPQLAQVLAREELGAAVMDEEFGRVFDDAQYDGPRVVAWHDGEPGGATLDALIERGAGAPSSRRQGRIVILTSGTTGTPKGAPRSPSVRALVGPGTTLLSKVPLRSREPMLVGPPFFHGFGLAYLGTGLFLGSTTVARRRFDPEATLAAIAEHAVTTLIAVPVMLQRVLELPEDTRRQYDTSSLRVVISAGSPLSADLAAAFMDAFGDVVYNLYGATETGFGAIADPGDLRAAPGTVGRPPLGTTLKILDDEGREVPRGETGRIFMGGAMVFEGYSGGGSKETVDGLMSTGDLGHLDDEGRLFVGGREDDMIVSGGENVFPQEVEDVLARHDGVSDVVVLGVDDEQFGQRLAAFVVKAPNADPTEDELKEHVKSNLARYKVPREIAFVDEVPRNPTGKVLRSRLVEKPS
jgi:acyl-CoA synthetase (AMP-forming)/AMP-acid ligase II